MWCGSNIWTPDATSDADQTKNNIMMDWIHWRWKKGGRKTHERSHKHTHTQIPTIHMYLLWVAESRPAGVGLALVIARGGGFGRQFQFGLEIQYWDVNILFTTWDVCQYREGGGADVEQQNVNFENAKQTSIRRRQVRHKNKTNDSNTD